MSREHSTKTAGLFFRPKAVDKLVMTSGGIVKKQQKYGPKDEKKDEKKEKLARELTAKGRRQIKQEHFALAGRRYPIHDRSHARNALSRVVQHGTPAEQARVRAAVHKRYPDMNKTAGKMRIPKFGKPPKPAANKKHLALAASLGAAVGGTTGGVAGHRKGHKKGRSVGQLEGYQHGHQLGHIHANRALRRYVVAMRHRQSIQPPKTKTAEEFWASVPDGQLLRLHVADELATIRDNALRAEAGQEMELIQPDLSKVAFVGRPIREIKQGIKAGVKRTKEIFGKKPKKKDPLQDALDRMGQVGEKGRSFVREHKRELAATTGASGLSGLAGYALGRSE